MHLSPFYHKDPKHFVKDASRLPSIFRNISSGTFYPFGGSKAKLDVVRHSIQITSQNSVDNKRSNNIAMYKEIRRTSI